MVQINAPQVRRFVDFFREAAEVKAFDFCTPGEGVLFPPRRQPGVVDFFFFCTAHQFGFWHLQDGRYAGPMIARIDGIAYKGSDYLVRCAMRKWLGDHWCFSTAQLEKISDAEWSRVFADDEGKNPLPLWPENLKIIRAYTTWLTQRKVTPEEIVEQANREHHPLAAFLKIAGRIPGYREDPLQKKLQLLAVILENRPEHFLRVTDPESYQPIIDYHLQRSALRTGLITVTDAGLRAKLEQRKQVTPDEEQQVRQATFEAVRRLVDQSGISVAAVDYFFFSNRTRCPEMTEPKCPICPVNGICEHATKLFQPVHRTTAY